MTIHLTRRSLGAGFGRDDVADSAARVGDVAGDNCEEVVHGEKAGSLELDYVIPSRSNGLPGAQVAKAAELLNYQDGAVVSRETVKKPTGNATLFAFDEGQGLSEYTAPFDALAQVVEGEAEIMISGQPHRLQGGACSFRASNGESS